MRNRGQEMKAGDGYAATAGSSHDDFATDSGATYLTIFRIRPRGTFSGALEPPRVRRGLPLLGAEPELLVVDDLAEGERIVAFHVPRGSWRSGALTSSGSGPR